jgi:class 3 adenylate cyclase
VRDRQGSGTASVLFTDLVGSTELLSRLGDLRCDEIEFDLDVLRPMLAAGGGPNG